MAREKDTALDTLDGIRTIVCTLVEVLQEHMIKKSASTSIPLPMSPLCHREHDVYGVSKGIRSYPSLSFISGTISVPTTLLASLRESSRHVLES